MKIVLSLGGSVFINNFDANRIRRFAEVIDRVAEDHKMFVVVGGGKIARDYISVARELGADNTFCDYIAFNLVTLIPI